MISSQLYADCASWIELSRQSFKNNVSLYKNAIPKDTLLGCVLKGNAYGHGFYECLTLLYAEVDILFLISPVDAYQVRDYEKQQGFASKRIVVLGAISAHEMVDCAKKNIETVISFEQAPENLLILQQFARSHPGFKPMSVHIHIDTGLGREGFTLGSLAEKIQFLKQTPGLFHVQGVMTHFSNVEDVTEQDYAYEQVKNLQSAYDIIKQELNLSYDPEKHVAQSASSLILPDSGCHIARVGISLYGLWPSKETKISAKVVRSELPKLTPVLSWRCQSQSVKVITEGSFIGYGCTYRADRDLKVALLPVGYFDGYPRVFSNKSFVLVNGKRCEILGRVMMNHIIVDVTEAAGDQSTVVATLIGKDGRETISAEMCASWADTINYEIVTRIGAHLKRVIVE